MKHAVVGFLLLAGLFDAASAQSSIVNFAPLGGPTVVTFSFSYDGGTDYLLASQNVITSPTDVVSYPAYPVTSGSLSYEFGIDSAVTGGGQWSFSVEGPVDKTIQGFTVSLSGLYPSDGNVITGVDFITGASSATLLAGTTGTYDSGTGTFTLTNPNSFFLPANTTYTLAGGLIAVPEPGSTTMLEGFGVLVLVLVRRKRGPIPAAVV